MNLLYEGKLEEKEIFEKAENAKHVALPLNEPVFIQGENFDVMSSLLASA